MFINYSVTIVYYSSVLLPRGCAITTTTIIIELY